MPLCIVYRYTFNSHHFAKIAKKVANLEIQALKEKMESLF